MTDTDAKRPVALVTGGARRIGRAIACDLAGRGFDIGVHYGSSADEARTTVAEIEACGGRAAALPADLADPQAPARLLAESVERLGPPTLLVNNASIFEEDTLADMTAARWDTHMAVNLRAPVLLAQAFAETLPRDAGGLIVNIVDQRVWNLSPDFFSYTLSKAGLWTATQTMAQALSPCIRVNAIAPGPTLPSTRQEADDLAKQQAATLLGRGPELGEICAAIRFFLDAPSMTGQMVALDGGQHLGWQRGSKTDYRE